MLHAATSGAPYERGYQYGQQLAGPIRRRAPANPLRAGGPGAAGEVAGNMLRYLERDEPALVDELRGLAAGAAVPFDAVLHLNLAPSVRYALDYRAPARPSASPGAARMAEPGERRREPDQACTNVAFAHTDDTDGGPLLGKTNDGGEPVPPERQSDAWVLQHVRPADGPPYLLLAPVGALAGVAGLSAAGLAVGQSAAQVVPDQAGGGVPSTLILRPLLERCPTVGAALDLLAGRALAGKGLNLMLLDTGGTVRAAEMSGARLGVRAPDPQGTLYFTNHCHTPALRDLPPRPDRRNSLDRWRRLEQLLDARSDGGEPAPAGAPARREGVAGGRGLQAMRALLADHGVSPAGGAGAPGEGAICQHGPDMYTSLSLVAAPREQALWVADGPACAAPFVAFRPGADAGEAG